MKVLMIRFSAMGDVALLNPVIRSALLHNDELEIHVVTKKNNFPFFNNLDKVKVLPVDFKKGFIGFLELIQFSFSLAQVQYDVVVDLHDNLRSRIICGLLRLGGKKTVRFDKARKQKSQLLGNIGPHATSIKHTVERYAEAMLKAGIQVDSTLEKLKEFHFVRNEIAKKKVLNYFNTHDADHDVKIGFAPFAQHALKTLGNVKSEELIGLLTEHFKDKAKVFLFGAGKTEMAQMQLWKSKFGERLILVQDQFTLEEQLELFNHLDVLVCMDSVNFHLANLSDIKSIISVWGPTHPFLGFGPLDETRNKILQITTTELTCRPCSVFGQKPCHRKDHACMQNISAGSVFIEVLNAITRTRLFNKATG